MLLEELGERLVTRDSSALAELVKNSYDADATSVTITFRNIAEPGGTIVVEDNGNGMDLESFRNGWMRIGTTMKTDTASRSPEYKRFRTGSKGVGRFACRRIANKLHLDTVSVDEGGLRSRIRAEFDWTRLKRGILVDEVSFPVEIQDKLPHSVPTGTTLTLVDVREGWDEEKVLRVRRELVSIIQPFPWHKSTVRAPHAAKSDPGMAIKVVAPQLKIEPEFGKQYLRAAWGVLKGRIDHRGKVTYQLRVNETGDVIRARPTRVVKLIGEASFEIHYVLHKPFELGEYSITAKESADVGRKHGGVRIFIDGFRVPAYGEPGDDWLGLDQTRAGRHGFLDKEMMEYFKANQSDRPVLLIPGNSQLFGGVFLSRKDSDQLKVSITRDRLIENDAFKELIWFVRTGIDFLTLEYARRVAGKRRKEEPIIRPETVVNAVDSVTTARKRIEEIADASDVPQADELLAAAVEVEEKATSLVQNMIDERSMLRVLASTGIMVSVFSHEVGGLLADLQEVLTQMNHSVARVSDKTKERLMMRRQSLESLASLVGLMLSKENRTRQRRVLVRAKIDDLIAAFSGHTNRLHVHPENEASTGVRTLPMFPGELYAILVNIMTNSLKAVRKSKRLRRIRFETERTKSELVIRVLDSGPGVKRELREVVFEPFKTFMETDKSDLMLGTGTGLGLTIVRSIVEDYAGRVQFVDPPSGWGACIEVRLPRK